MQVMRCTRCMGELEDGVRVCPHCGYEQDSDGQPTIALKRNTILHGRYLIGNVIGQGGFGITYVGFDLTLEMKVAVKEYFPSGSASRTNSSSNQIEWDSINQDSEDRSEGMDRFLKEARRMARLDDVPSIVRVRDAFGENQTAYIVMDFVEGVTLKKYLLGHGVLRFDECMGLLSPILDSLAVIHDCGFIHRDISPDNIMLQPNGSARLLDMGAAVDVRASGGHASMAVIKRNFSAPEQYMESESLGSWTDVYAMGATIYYCLTGKVVPEAMEREFKRLPLYFDPGLNIPEQVIEALNGALELHAEKRIQDMREFKRRLSQLGQQTIPQPWPVPEPVPPAASFNENDDDMKTTPYFGEAAEKRVVPDENSVRGARKKKWGLKSVLTAIGALLVLLVVFYRFQSAKYADDMGREKLEQIGLTFWAEAASFDEADLTAELKHCNETLASMDYGAVAVEDVLTVKSAAGESLGYLIVSSSNDAFKEAIRVAVGVDEDGTVAGIEFLEINETPKLGMQAKEPKFKDQYKGKKATAFEVVKGGGAGGAEINAISGATITSKAVTNAVNAALYFVQEECN